MTIVDLLEQWRDLRIVETGELGRAPGPLHRAAVHRVERDPRERPSQGCGLGLAPSSERNVGDAGVLT